MTKTELELVLDGFQTEIPFYKSGLKLNQILEQSIVAKHQESFEDFVTLCYKHVGNNANKATPQLIKILTKRLQEHVAENKNKR